MWKFILFWALLILSLNNYLLNFLAPFLRTSHAICLELSPQSAQFQNLYTAMVCGESLAPSDFGDHLRVLGLYHLIVVSGSHFVLLEAWLFKLATPLRGREFTPILIFIGLTLFACVCRMDPPVFRAWLSFLLRKTNQEQKLFWPSHLVALLSGVISFLLFPAWLGSLSFQLSWAAAILVSLPLTESWRKHGLIYLGLLPVIYGLQPAHPVTSLSNWVLAPVIGGGLFPISLVAFAVPWLVPLTDGIWRFIEFGLARLAQEVPVALSDSPAFSYWAWVYLIGLHAVIWFVFCRARRAIHSEMHNEMHKRAR